MKTKSILMLICIALMTSCASKFGVMKRRYNKGFYVSVSNDHKTPATLHKQVKSKVAIARNEQVIVQRVETSIQNQPVTIAEKPNNTETFVMSHKKTTRSQSDNIYASAGKSKVSVFKAKSLAQEIKKQQRSEGGKGNANAIVLIILCIVLPPLAVYLFHGAINSDFWLSLILTILFWVPGVVWAFLVCFAGVSIA